MTGRLSSAARLVLITDGVGDAGRIAAIVDAAVAGGLRAVQVREPKLGAGELLALCGRLLPVLDAVDGLLLINDRVDVAAAGAAHGVHLGHRSLPPSVARRCLGSGPVIGFSAHDADELRWAAAEGADYASLSPVFSTTSKPGVAALGVARAAAIVADAALPVVWLGGIDADRVTEVAAHRPFGIATMSAISSAVDPAAVAHALLERLTARCVDR